MSKKLIKKHDPLAKQFLTDLNVAREFLTIHLAPEIVKNVILRLYKLRAGHI